MTDPMQSLVKQTAARLRGHLSRGNRHRAIELREYATLPKDMPWYPHVPELTTRDLQLLRWLRQELSSELGPPEIISDADLVSLAVQELELALRSADREDEILRLRFYLAARENPAIFL